jgi:hypothetical protein
MAFFTLLTPTTGKLIIICKHRQHDYLSLTGLTPMPRPSSLVEE